MALTPAQKIEISKQALDYLVDLQVKGAHSQINRIEWSANLQEDKGEFAAIYNHIYQTIVDAVEKV